MIYVENKLNLVKLLNLAIYEKICLSMVQSNDSSLKNIIVKLMTTKKNTYDKSNIKYKQVFLLNYYSKRKIKRKGIKNICLKKN